MSSRPLVVCCALLYICLAGVILRRGFRTAPVLLACCCLVTAAWAATAAIRGTVTLSGIESPEDLARALAWFGFVLFLYHDARFGKPAYVAAFAAAGLAATVLSILSLIDPDLAIEHAVFSPGMLGRLGLAVTELLVIENLYLNLPEQKRWHIALPSVMLGGLACFDIVLCCELALYHQPSTPLLAARTVGMIMITPLLVVAAARGQRWTGRVKLSRSAAFHSATLLLSGSVLVVLAGLGEVFDRLNGSWTWFIEASLAFGLIVGLGLMLTSAAARSRFQHVFVDHFFAERYDYRREWLSCMDTLSGDDADVQSALATRAIRALASVVDSPAGALFLRDQHAGAFAWAGSWNLPGTDSIPADHPVLAEIHGGEWIGRLDGTAGELAAIPPLDGLGPLWLVIPLLHRDVATGLVFVTPPRAPFRLEQEVFDLLRIVSQEVSTYIAEQRATQTLLQTRHLHDYSKRFAFVAHDIKNVSSQLALLLTNATSHIANPEFQKDMLETVEASVRKIGALLERLERPEVDRAPAALSPVSRLKNLIATYRRVRRTVLVLEDDGSTGTVSIGADAFETAVTHLLNNAVEASGGAPVVVRIRHEARQVVVEVSDYGPGMTAEFIRDELFEPFSTSKAGGSGIGAFQARELVREAGGDLAVISEPGRGTTVQLLLPRTDTPGPAGPMHLRPAPAEALSRPALSRAGP